MRQARNVARVRRRLARLSRRALLGKVGGRVPNRYARSLVEQAGNPAVARHIEDTALLTPACVEQYDLDPGLPPQFRRCKAFDDRHLYRLRDVRAAPRTGLCWLPDGPILEESYGSLIRLLGWGEAALDDPMLRPTASVEGPAVILPADGYFHWLLEALPAALHALAWVPGATLVLPATAPRYVLDAVRELGIERIEQFDGPVQVEELILCARDPFSGFVPREDVEILRRSFRPDVRGSRESLYVSRRRAGRAPSNERDLEAELSSMGLRVVHAEELTLGEQVALFQQADVIVGPHGAGLANLLWSDASSLHEIFVAGHFNDCYARMASLVGAEYRPHYSTGDGWGEAPIDAIVGQLHGRSGQRAPSTPSSSPPHE